jgi:hypothetical protein
MGLGGQGHAPATLPQGKRPGTHCIGGCVGSRAGLDRCGKSCPPPGLDPRTLKPVASHYANWANPVHIDWHSRPIFIGIQWTQYDDCRLLRFIEGNNNSQDAFVAFLEFASTSSNIYLNTSYIEFKTNVPSVVCKVKYWNLRTYSLAYY